MIPLLTALCLSLPQEAVPVPSRITEVTVYPGSASVRRSATLPSGSGTFVLEGLPRGLDADALRVRAVGTEVVGVELRSRVLAEAPEARVQALVAQVQTLRRELQALGDDRAVLDRLKAHLDRLIEPPAPGGDTPPAGSVEAWSKNFEYLQTQLTAVHRRGRELDATERELRRRLEDVELELGRANAGDGVWVYDLHVDAFGGAGGASLEVDYIVGGAGWSPRYDLRAPKDLSGVELAYRAQVWQQSGEDWNDVALALSTAEPRRGTRGPDPMALTVGVFDPDAIVADRRMAATAPMAEEDAAALGYLARAQPPTAAAEPLPFASVQDEGLSVRFRLAGNETVESRRQPSVVLVGRAPLVIHPEHYCVPALDPSVWLRAKATNTSEYTLLPGRASVYFGADFLGHADLPAVQPDERFDVPLGLDPGLTVERVQLEDVNEEPGRFGSRRTQRDTWRVHLKNHGGFSSRADGSVSVVVHESLPKPTNERIEVSLERVRPELAKGERWKKLREEEGVLSWIVRVPKGGGTTLELATEITYPEDEVLVRR